MKSALRHIHVLFLLFEICVFGDEVKAEIVSVIEGDSVTLHTGVTEIQRDYMIEWRLNGKRVARISGDPSRTDGVFRDGLKLDKRTGDLKITNIKITDSGEYILKITSTVSSEKTFSVNVVSGVGEVKSVSVTVGDSVTLNSRTNIQRDDVIQWRFADINSPIAENNRKTVNFSTSDVPDGIFRHRLQLDYSTGSLTIWKIETNHSGLYEAVIRKSGSGYTVHQSYSVTVSGERKPALVKMGDSVTLHTDLTEIHTDDLMLWMFEDTVIAEINKAQNRFSTSDVFDGRFRDRLKLDHQTGSLTITHTRTEDSGLYELKIISSRFTINKRITVSVTHPGLSAGGITGIVVGLLLVFAAAAVGVICYYRSISELIVQAWRTLSVGDGEPVTLNPDEVHKDDKLLWIIESSCIAERKSAADSFTVYDDGLPKKGFKGRLKLDHQTGSLTIMNTRPEDSGEYTLLIIGSRNISIKTFCVSVVAQTEIETVSVNKGESVTLPSGVADIQTVGAIQWKFGLNIWLTEITRETKKISPLADQIFQGRLDLDHQTGSLIIKNSKPTDAGMYMLYKIEKNILKDGLFRVKVIDLTDNRNNPQEKSVTTMDNPEEVPLNSVETFPDSRL